MTAHSVDGRIVSVNVAAAKGVRKDPVAAITLVPEHGVEGDAHAGPWHRQVSLLAARWRGCGAAGAGASSVVVMMPR